MDIKLPKLGEGADSGTVVSILVKEGDQIKKGQTVIELENEKAVAPIPSPANGTVSKLRVKEGDKLSVGQVILALVIEGDAAPAPEPVAERRTPAPAERRSAAPAPAPVPELPEAEEAEPSDSALAPAAPPSIRRFARDLGLDLRRVRGSGPGGRIGMEDLRGYIQRLMKLAAQARAAVPATPAAPPKISIDFSQWGPVVKKPMTTLRKTIATRMTENWNAVPHVFQFDEVDITALDALRKKYAPAYEAQGARLTLTPLALKAVVAALKKHPLFNASLDEASDDVVFKSYYHIGVAVDTEAGLIVPVIRNVDTKGLLELSKDLDEAAKKARERKVSLDDLKGGTFTISNQGGIGGGHFTPIINKPEVAILGLGRGVVKPVVKDGQVVPRLMMPITISYDHRLIDGGAAARFTVDLVAAFGSIAETDVKL
ncbi:MAG: 2-oxo acid dehydrogenase subunit E2 [Verrucomicrobia bacterium]|nr:2-oxo acid dehydrogenase subunit E2 [Verrucomicrobiota bacterium]